MTWLGDLTPIRPVRLEGRQGHPYGPDLIAYARGLWEGTRLSSRAIARRTGASQTTVCQWANAAGWTRPPGAPRSHWPAAIARGGACARRAAPARAQAEAARLVGEAEAAGAADLDTLAAALALLRRARRAG